MTVAELIATLQETPQDAEVVVFTLDGHMAVDRVAPHDDRVGVVWIDATEQATVCCS